MSDLTLCFINKHSSSSFMLESQVKETCQSKADSQWVPQRSSDNSQKRDTEVTAEGWPGTVQYMADGIEKKEVICRLWTIDVIIERGL